MALSHSPDPEPEHEEAAHAPDEPAVVSHPGYFSKVIVRTEDDPRRIDVVRSIGSQPAPPEVRDLLKQIQEVGRLVVTLFPTDLVRRKDFFGQLHATADSGLRGT